jgi:hypothetical protein
MSDVYSGSEQKVTDMAQTKLTRPVFILKRQARQLARDSGIPLHQALDRVARNEGFSSWSLLAARLSPDKNNRLGSGHNGGQNSGKTGDDNRHQLPIEPLRPGDLILVAARPGQGKTAVSLEVLLKAVNAGCRGLFFTLEYNQLQAAEVLRTLGGEDDPAVGRVEIDSSDDISAPYIIERLSDGPRTKSAAATSAHSSTLTEPLPGTVVVIDYLQLLDQKRTSPDLNLQLAELKEFAVNQGICMIFISQVHRAFDLSTRRFPGIEDIRLPNPVDLAVFNKACFLHNREVVCNPMQ